jgi:predicted O-methyltransferase YrrM
MTESTSHPSVARRLERVCELPLDWHGAGTVPNRVLRAIARYAPVRVEHSVETGTGRSTLLFSTLSRHHLVFAKDDRDDGQSLDRVRRSELLTPGIVEFIVGPTQTTLPSYDLPGSLDIVFLDGPHGFPFPQLEYYYFYPRVRAGGLLVVDDIQIPSVRQLYCFLRRDRMWHLSGVVARTAFFTRTTAATLDPFGDGWWLQGYNRSRSLAATAWMKTHAPERVKSFWRRVRGPD